MVNAWLSVGSGKRFAVAGLALLVLGCEATGTYQPGGTEPPAQALQRQRQVRPEVVSVSMSNSSAEGIDIIVQFSTSMDKNSVEVAISALAAESSVRSSLHGEPLEIIDSFDWRADGREVFFRVESTVLPVILVLESSAESEEGLGLDGAVSADLGDILSFHRYEDDGFSGATTYVSLPFYPGGTDNLAGHPSYLLSDARPRLVCSNLQFDQSIANGNLGTLVEGTPIRCQLNDKRFAPDRTDITERTAPRAWDPARLPKAQFQQGSTTGAIIDGVIGLGVDGNLPTEPKHVVLTTADSSLPNRMTLLNLGLSGDERFEQVYLAPGISGEPIWPVTGGNAPDTLWMATVLFSGTADEEGADRLMYDVDGQAWVTNEFSGQRFRKVVGGASSVIESNSANELLLNLSSIQCVNCAYEIRSRTGGRYSAGNEVRLTSSAFVVRPAEPLASGQWTLTISGGHDLQGLALTDGIRNGDEIRNTPTDAATFTVTVP